MIYFNYKKLSFNESIKRGDDKVIFQKKELEKKMIDKDMNRKKLAQAIGICPSTLSSKIDKPNSDFKLLEALQIAKHLEMSDEEFMWIFFNKKLSLNESD